MKAKQISTFLLLLTGFRSSFTAKNGKKNQPLAGRDHCVCVCVWGSVNSVGRRSICCGKSLLTNAGWTPEFRERIFSDWKTHVYFSCLFCSGLLHRLRHFLHITSFVEIIFKSLWNFFLLCLVIARHYVIITCCTHTPYKNDFWSSSSQITSC